MYIYDKLVTDKAPARHPKTLTVALPNSCVLEIVSLRRDFGYTGTDNIVERTISWDAHVTILYHNMLKRIEKTAMLGALRQRTSPRYREYQGTSILMAKNAVGNVLAGNLVR